MSLNRTGIAEVIAEEGFERLWRRPEVLRGAPRREQLPRTGVIDFDTWPERVETKHAGLLLCMPDLVAMDLPAVVKAAGYPGTSVIPAVSSVLSLLALKLANIRRTSHVEDLATDHGAALFAGLSSLPKTTALTSYSYKLSHERRHAFLVALNTAMLRAGLIDGADFDLDFHAIMHWGEDPALEKHYVPSRSADPVGADVLRPRRRHPQPHLRQRRHLQGHPSPRGDRVLRALASADRHRPRGCWCSIRSSPPRPCSPSSTSGVSRS